MPQTLQTPTAISDQDAATIAAHLTPGYWVRVEFERLSLTPQQAREFLALVAQWARR